MTDYYRHRPRTDVYWVGFLIPKALFNHPPGDPLFHAKPVVVRSEAGFPYEAIASCLAVAQDTIHRPVVVVLTDLLSVYYSPPMSKAYDKLVTAPPRHPMHGKVLHLGRSALRTLARGNVLPGPGRGGVYLHEWTWPSDLPKHEGPTTASEGAQTP